MSLFDKFDKEVDWKKVNNEVKEIETNGGGDYPTVPYGKYEVKVNKMELGISKTSQLPMLKIQFKILAGQYKNSLLFYNQVLNVNSPFTLHNAKEMLRSMDTTQEIKIDSFKQFEQLVMDIHEEIDGKVEFALDYSEEKGFARFEILEVFDAQ